MGQALPGGKPIVSVARLLDDDAREAGRNRSTRNRDAACQARAEKVLGRVG